MKELTVDEAVEHFKGSFVTAVERNIHTIITRRTG
jgi:hypothetical protein